MIISIKSRSSSILGHPGSKTRSQAFEGQIIEKACEHTRGHNFDLIFMKLDHNDHHYKI